MFGKAICPIFCKIVPTMHGNVCKWSPCTHCRAPQLKILTPVCSWCPKTCSCGRIGWSCVARVAASSRFGDIGSVRKRYRSLIATLLNNVFGANCRTITTFYVCESIGRPHRQRPCGKDLDDSQSPRKRAGEPSGARKRSMNTGSPRNASCHVTLRRGLAELLRHGPASKRPALVH